MSVAGAFPLVHSISTLTFNTRALFHHVPATCALRIDYVLTLARRHDIVTLEETHGTPALVRKYFACSKSTHFVLSSFCNAVSVNKNGRHHLRSDAGGIVVLIKRRLFDGCKNPYISPPDEIVKGRVLRAKLVTEHGCFTIFAIHNFGLSKENLALVKKAFQDEIDDVYKNPLTHFVLAQGDLNIREDDETPIETRPDATFTYQKQANNQRANKRTMEEDNGQLQKQKRHEETTERYGRQRK